MIQKLGDLATCGEAFSNIVRLNLSAKKAYHIAKLARLVEKEIIIYNDLRMKLIEETKDDTKELESKIKELNDTEVTIDWKPIPIEWLEDQNLKAADFMGMGSLIEGEMKLD